MDPRPLLVSLESPLHSYAAEIPSRRDVLMAGLESPSDYWIGLAIGWLEQGLPIDGVIAATLKEIEEKKSLPQPLRHRAMTLANRWAKMQ